MFKPYFGARKVPKNRVRGTSEQCIKSGQARYYGINSVEDVIDEILADKRKLANEKAKLKRQEAKKKVDDANKKIKQANVAVKEANKAKKESKKAEQEAKNTTAKNTTAKKPRGRLPKNNNPFAKMILDNKKVRNLPIV